MTGPTGSAGQGRLAKVLAARGGRADPEAPFVIEHREALIYMLCQAAEIEHGIMCQYLFAAFSLKQRADEGLDAEELEAVTRWRLDAFQLRSLVRRGRLDARRRHPESSRRRHDAVRRSMARRACRRLPPLDRLRQTG